MGFTYVTYPSGKVDTKPRDGHVTWHQGQSFMWDGYLERWVDDKGEMATVKGVCEEVVKCDCGGEKTGQTHFNWCGSLQGVGQ